MEKIINEIRAVVFDWAGTTVDFGCFAPANVFIEVFKRKGILITIEQARKPMGMNKRDHILEILKMKEIEEQWIFQFGRIPDINDLDAIYSDFIPLQLEEIKLNCKLIPGVIELSRELKKRNIKIGSSSGYNKEMMDIVMAEAALQGFEVDFMACSTDVKNGRPAPWMAILNAMHFNIYPLNTVLKIGDTFADISEGLNAGMWSVAVVDSSNEMGLSLEEINSLTVEELESRREIIREKFYDAGAHYVINNTAQLLPVIDVINEHLKEINI